METAEINGLAISQPNVLFGRDSNIMFITMGTFLVVLFYN